MKWFVFKLVAVFGALLAAPMLIKGPDGQPIMSPADWVPENAFSRLVDFATGVVDSVEDAGAAATGIESVGDQVYSWRDANGTLHYSDTPAAGAAAVELPENSLEIPAERFIQHGTRPASEGRASPSGGAVLLNERSGRGGSAGSSVNSADLEAFVGGDYSKAGAVLKNMPAILEQAKKARAIDPETR